MGNDECLAVREISKATDKTVTVYLTGNDLRALPLARAQIWKTRCRFAKRGADLENAVQIWKTPCRFGKRGADLENAAQICKAPCRFAKRRADLQSAVQICKSSCRFAKRRADLQIVVQICERNIAASLAQKGTLKSRNDWN